MDNNPLKFTLWSTPLLRVFDFMLDHSEEELIDAEIASRIESVKKSAVNIALRKLADLSIVERKRRGRMVFNKLIESPLVLRFKALSNMMSVQPLVDVLKPLCSRVIFFGSRSDGTNSLESDFDLYVVTSNEEKVWKEVRQSKLSERIQLIVKSPDQSLDLDRTEPVLYEQLKSGIVLWQQE
jgi:hypothetical protein